MRTQYHHENPSCRTIMSFEIIHQLPACEADCVCIIGSRKRSHHHARKNGLVSCIYACPEGLAHRISVAVQTDVRSWFRKCSRERTSMTLIKMSDNYVLPMYRKHNDDFSFERTDKYFDMIPICILTAPLARFPHHESAHVSHAGQLLRELCQLTDQLRCLKYLVWD